MTIITQPVTTYNRTSYDVPNEKITDARNIGLLDPGRTVLDVNSALAGKDNDKQDFFQFNLTKNAPIGLTVTDPNGNVSNARVQVFDRSGRVIADSAATTGSLQANWKAINGSTYNGTKGYYYVSIQRPTGTPVTSDLQYSFQVRSGFTYREDYVTTEKRETAVSTGLTGAASLASSLVSNITSQDSLRDSWGEDFTQKLLNSLV